MSEEKTYQPKWDEHKDRKHHHHHHGEGSFRTGKDSRFTNSWGGAMKLRDKQAYYGLMFALIATAGVGAYMLIMLFVNEWRAMPHDDPTTEMNVDELDIRKVEKQDALLTSDSIAQIYQFDSSTIHRVQTESHHVYRPPRKNKEWYLTEREWLDIKKNFRRWKQSKKNDKQFKEEEAQE